MSEIQPQATSTIKPIDVTMTQLELLKKVLKNSKVSDTVKERLQKESGFGMCCCCGGIAQHIASYDCAGATRKERYCSPCVEKQFSRAKG
jgi:hypothetical protein